MGDVLQNGGAPPPQPPAPAPLGNGPVSGMAQQTCWCGRQELLAGPRETAEVAAEVAGEETLLDWGEADLGLQLLLGAGQEGAPLSMNSP